MSVTRQRTQGPRLLQLVRLLGQGALTSAQLAERLGCTQQEVQRDLRLMRAEGWPVQGTDTRPRAYSLGSGAPGDPDPVRAVIHHALLRMLHHHAPTPSRLYHQASEELAQHLPMRLRDTVQRSLNPPDGDTPRVLETLAAAWCWGQSVRFAYRKPGEAQAVWSEGDVVFMEVNRSNLDWYIFLRRRDENRVKTFHLSRVVDAVRLEVEASPATAFDPRTELDGAWGIIGAREHCEVTLRFHPDAVPWVAHRRWPGQISGEMQGKHYLLRLRAPLHHSGLPVEVLAWIRGWGPRVEVVSPEPVRQCWLDEAREVLRLYGTQETDGA